MLKPGTSVGPFEVLSSLGAGGMGEVYRASDPRLERDVALKVLPASTLSDETARERMVREARMAAKLNHPNICTIYEVGEAEGQVYIAMELVEGEPLDTILGQGALPTEQAMRYGEQIAEALAHAHERDVVHRDLKSANVVITPEGRAKVLDFGLAKRLAGEELAEVTTQLGASLTAPGSLVGTLAYMAPEQLHGHPADARSDVWALGAVLYEMLGGRRPFVAQTGFALSSAILNDAPSPLPASVPATLRAVVERCLAKPPDERFQKAEEVRAALETVQSGGAIPSPARLTSEPRRQRWPLAAAALAVLAVVLVTLDVGGVRRLLLDRGGGQPRVVRMAVLPFANLSGDPEQEYLSDGITQEMITQLGRLHPESLSVIARTSVMRYKNGDTPVDQIGEELNVDYVLEGSAMREANHVRIAAELIHVEDQTQLWANSYEREFAGILSLQSEVAQQVAEALALELLPAEKARLASAPTVDPEAYDAYLKGTYHWQKLTPADLDTAQRYFELALEKDPSYARAYEGLSYVWGCRGFFMPAHEVQPKARAAGLQAIALDDGSAEAHELLAMEATWYDWDWDGAEPEWRIALKLNPNSANGHAYYAHFLAITGRAEEAIPHSERALELDPVNALYHGLYAVVLYYNRRYDNAMVAARTAIAIQPGLLIAHAALQNVFISKGMREEQLAHQRDRIAHDPERVAAFEQGLQEGGYEGAQRAIADLLAARYEKDGWGGSGAAGIALRYLDAGDHARAIDWLERAYEASEPGPPYFGSPIYDPLRPDPRYQALLRRMSLPLD